MLAPTPGTQRTDPGHTAAHEGHGTAVTLRLLDIGHGTRTVLTVDDAVAPEGAHVLIVGDNGSGKTTLLQTLAGLLPKRSGHAVVAGHEPLIERRALHEAIGHLGHTDPFYPELTGRENLTYHARLRRLPPSAVETGLHEVDLDRAADRPVGDYSHGMRRRLGIAKALLGDPPVVLLDEPESGLDAAGRAILRRLLDRRPGRTILLSTHHWAEWIDWADTAWVLHRGTLHAVQIDQDASRGRDRIQTTLDRGPVPP